MIHRIRRQRPPEHGLIPQRLKRRLPRRSLKGQRQQHMILQVLPHIRILIQHLHALRPQQRSPAHTRQLQQLRRLECAGAENDLPLCGHGVGFPFDAEGQPCGYQWLGIRLDGYSGSECAGQDFEVWSLGVGLVVSGGSVAPRRVLGLDGQQRRVCADGEAAFRIARGSESEGCICGLPGLVEIVVEGREGVLDGAVVALQRRLDEGCVDLLGYSSRWRMVCF